MLILHLPVSFQFSCHKLRKVSGWKGLLGGKDNQQRLISDWSLLVVAYIFSFPSKS